jgi:tetratricopeptide (TPR) repeat protein
VKRALLAAVLFAAMAAGAVAYQAAARQRDYRIQLARGDAALHDDQTFAAIEAYSGAIAMHPQSMLAHLRLGETYQRRGDLDEAAREFRRAAALDPGATRPLEELGDTLYQLQRFELGAEAYERYLALEDRSPRVMYKLALARYREGQPDAAIAATEQMVRLEPLNADAYYMLGICLREKRQLPEAARAFEQAIVLEPGQVAAREELADLYGSLGRRQNEIEQLEVLAGLDRDRVERQVAVGLAHARAGHKDLAVVLLRNMLERVPNHPLVYTALGRVWLDQAPARTDALPKAIEALLPVAASGAASSEILTLYGRALILSGNPAAAERALAQATTQLPVDPAGFLYLATAAEQQGHLAEARQALIAYVGLVLNDPDLVSHATRVAALSLRLQDAATAAKWFERAAAANPDDVRLLASLADAQLRSGAREAAERTIARGLKKDPANAPLLALSARLSGFRLQGAGFGVRSGAGF